MKHIRKKVLIIFISIFLVSCSVSNNNSDNTDDTDNTTHTSTYYTQEDLDSTYDVNNATIITLSDQDTKIDGAGATFENGDVNITKGQTYIISGTLTQGRILVNSNDKNTVRLVLNGVSINYDTSSPIYIIQANKTIITLAENTKNSLSDTSNYQFDAGLDEPDATLYSEDDLVINGKGTLNIESNYRNGLASKDKLIIIEGTFNISAVNDAVRGRDSLVVRTGVFNINSGSDGFKSNNDVDTSLGYIVIESGEFNVKVGSDGFQAETLLEIKDGYFEIETITSTTSSDSQKGLKAGNNITIHQGTFYINTTDDTIHSNNTLLIKNGTFELSSNDDGIHADGSLVIEDGSIDILKSYEGLEGLSVLISGGNIKIKSLDDGINAAGGNDSTYNGMNGRDPFNATSNNEEIFIKITGGTTYIDASGDGIDSNNTLTITGGTIIVEGPLTNGDGSIDYDGEGTITGGNLIAIGSAGMVQAFSNSSTQAVITINVNAASNSNNVVRVLDSNKNVITELNTTKAFQNIIISNENIQLGETYMLEINNEVIETITVDSLITSIGNSTNQDGGRPQSPGRR